MEDFKEPNPIAYLKVWVQIPRIPMQFREMEIMKNITQSIGRLIRLDAASINSLNPMAISVVIDVDIHLPLKISWFMNKMFEDDLNVLPEEGVKGLGLALPNMDDDLIFCFLQSGIIKEDGPRDESMVGSKNHNRIVTHVIKGPPQRKKKSQDSLGKGVGCSHVVAEN
ncbi:hypothetical protein D8674_003932 [Pyrus ussuriensis x Pyrus communis]|uniref:Uncharacterized protein n=1 Tax=Pyrus ussuriensis x Pyrus communis TaxID=2448454 RepID=A0A5N5FJ15_9ROSA|nr:hypothetical protein D8674_003932 [Pyrus ussuriensis x Pyrus communis]